MSAPETTVTFFTHFSARTKTEQTIDKAALADLIRSEHAEHKENLRWLKLARFGNLKTAKDSLRHDRNVLAVHGIEADYDGEQISFDEAVGKLEAAGIDSIVYTSPRHTPEKPRWRILCFLSTHYLPGERAKFVARVNGLFAGAIGEESFTLSQSYYFGYLTNGTGAAPSHRVEMIDGEFIDLLDELDNGAIGKSGKKPKDDGGDYQDFTDIGELIRRIVSGEALHNSVTAIAGKLARQGVGRATATEIIGGAFNAAKQDRYGPRWQECKTAINDIYDKEESKQQAPPPGTAPLPPDVVFEDFYAFLPKHWYLYVPTQTLWPPATINSRLGKKDGLKATRWLDKFRAVSQMIWAPGREQIVNNKHLIEGGWLDKPGAIVFNQYRQPTLFGGDPALAGPWLDLLKKLYPVQLQHDHIIKVLAHKLQHPEIKINHALVLGGGMRIGKDTLLVPVKRALGSWNYCEARPATIMGNHNGYMRSVLLVINETRDLGEVKKYQFYDHMKDVIVAPPETVLVNEKYEKHVHVANVCLVIMTTNHRTDGIYLPAGDGRHFPVWSEVKEEDFEGGFFKRYYFWLNHGGDAHVAAFLRSYDVSDFDYGAPPPRTPLFYEIVDASRPLETSWLEDRIEDLGRPSILTFELLLAGAMGDLLVWLQNKGNARALPYRLEEAGYVRVPSSRTDGKWTRKSDGKRIIIYGNSSLTTKERQEACSRMAT